MGVRKELDMWGFNSDKDIFKMSNYTKWYHYFWVMPMMAIFILYIRTDNFIYGIVEKFKSK